LTHLHFITLLHTQVVDSKDNAAATTAPPTDKQDSTDDGKISDNHKPTDPPKDEQQTDKEMVR